MRYSIYDLNGNIVLREETDRPLTVSMLNENVVDIRVGMGTGIVRHKYYDIQNNRFSQDYDYVAATSGNLVAYIDCSMADPMYNRKLVVRDIFDASTFCKSFSLYFSTVGVLAQTPILSASFTEGEDELELVYLSGVSCVQLTATLPIRHVVSPEEVSPEAEKAMQAYEAVLQNKLKVFDTDAYEFFYIRNGRRPYDRTPLSELTDVKYAYMDLDGDTVNELIIDCGDTLILRYYEGTVYMYSFTFRNMYDLNTDGSYSWNHMGTDFEYGAKRLAFDGAKRCDKELWRIVNDGEPNAAYYIEEKQVSREELLAYLENNPEARVTFAPLELSMEGAVSQEEALKIADEYWGGVDGGEDAACGSLYINRVIIDHAPSPLCPFYRIAWNVEHYYSGDPKQYEGYEDGRPHCVATYNQVLVNIYTGECTRYADPGFDGKGAPYDSFAK